MIREMKIEDYDAVYALWTRIQGFHLRKVDDSREKITAFLQRNAGLSVVAEVDGKLVGTVLSGQDGRRGCFYHVCVEQAYRKRGLAKQMVIEALRRQKEVGISKVSIVAFQTNALGNGFWSGLGWTLRSDLNYYDLTLNEQNQEQIVEA